MPKLSKVRGRESAKPSNGLGPDMVISGRVGKTRRASPLSRPVHQPVVLQFPLDYRPEKM